MIWPQTRTYSQDSTTCKNHDKLEYFGQLRLTSIWYPEQPAPTECPIPSILDAKMISFSFQCQMNPSSLLLPLCGHWNVHAHTHAGTKLWKGVGRSRACLSFIRRILGLSGYYHRSSHCLSILLLSIPFKNRMPFDRGQKLLLEGHTRPSFSLPVRACEYVYI
jgi:hypothetical protein